MLTDEGIRQAAYTLSGVAERLGTAANSLWETVDRFVVNANGLADRLERDRQARETNDDAELLALAALVQLDAALTNAQIAQYGQLMQKPDTRAADALTAKLEARGVLKLLGDV
jgi:hypothetical protein